MEDPQRSLDQAVQHIGQDAVNQALQLPDEQIFRLGSIVNSTHPDKNTEEGYIALANYISYKREAEARTAFQSGVETLINDYLPHVSGGWHIDANVAAGWLTASLDVFIEAASWDH